MIIQCKKCDTSYRFDETLIDGAGIRVRCTQCQNVFSLENPVNQKIIFSAIRDDDDPRADDAAGAEDPEAIVAFEDIDEEDSGDRLILIDEDVEAVPDTAGPDDKPTRMAAVESGDNVAAHDGSTGGEEWPPEVAEPASTAAPSPKRAKVLGAVIAVLVTAFAAYLVMFPQFRHDLYGRIVGLLPREEAAPAGKIGVGTQESQRAEIYFIDTKEKAINNWIVGDILVVEGIAMNKGGIPASKVKVRGRILDAAGVVLMEETCFGGTVFSEEELRNLTEEELHAELSNPWGRDFDNRNIPKDGRLPFTLVFVNPPENAHEYVVDLASVAIGRKE